MHKYNKKGLNKNIRTLCTSAIAIGFLDGKYFSYRHIGFCPQYTKYLEVNDYSMLVMELSIRDNSRNW